MAQTIATGLRHMSTPTSNTVPLQGYEENANCSMYVFLICIHTLDHDKCLPGWFTGTSRTVHKCRTDTEPVECMVKPPEAKFVGFN